MMWWHFSTVLLVFYFMLQTTAKIFNDLTIILSLVWKAALGTTSRHRQGRGSTAPPPLPAPSTALPWGGPWGAVTALLCCKTGVENVKKSSWKWRLNILLWDQPGMGGGRFPPIYSFSRQFAKYLLANSFPSSYWETVSPKIECHETGTIGVMRIIFWTEWQNI